MLRGLLCLFCVMLSTLSGCANNIFISDTSLPDNKIEIKSIRIIIEDAVKKNEQIWSSEPELASRVDSFTRSIGENSEATWPTLFSSYGVLAEITRTSTQNNLPHFSIVLIEAPKTIVQYELFVKLNAITPKNSSSFSVEYVAELRSKKLITTKPLWKGVITIQPNMWATQKSIAIKIGETLLNQWKKDGVVTIKP